MHSLKVFMAIEDNDEESLKNAIQQTMGDKISDMIVYNSEDSHDRSRLRILGSVIADILEHETSTDSLDDDAIAVYESIRNLSEDLQNIGIDAC